MNKPQCENIKFLIVIAGRKHKDRLLDEMTGHGCKIINVVYGKSSVTGGYIGELLGFVPEEQKVVFTALLPSENVAGLIEILNVKYNFGDPNSGIAFTVSVNGICV